MVTLTIDNQTVRVAEGTTILEAAKSAGIIIPHLCYLKELNEIAACRVCSVEVEGETAMVTACNILLSRAWASIPIRRWPVKHAAAMWSSS